MRIERFVELSDEKRPGASFALHKTFDRQVPQQGPERMRRILYALMVCIPYSRRIYSGITRSILLVKGGIAFWLTHLELPCCERDSILKALFASGE